MKILIVSATAGEVAPLLAELHAEGPGPPLRKDLYLGPHVLDLLVTGMGMVATAYAMGRVFACNHYDLAVNVGLAGYFEAPARHEGGRKIAPGGVVRIVTDRIAELGVGEGDRFMTMEEAGLMREPEYAFLSPSPETPHFKGPAAFFFTHEVFRGLPGVSAVTVNRLSTKRESIQEMADRFQPWVESMEGAAFMHACSMQGTPCAQVRAVSNNVGDRNRENWAIPLAVQNLNRTLLKILKT